MTVAKELARALQFIETVHNVLPVNRDADALVAAVLAKRGLKTTKLPKK